MRGRPAVEHADRSATDSACNDRHGESPKQEDPECLGEEAQNQEAVFDVVTASEGPDSDEVETRGVVARVDRIGAPELFAEHPVHVSCGGHKESSSACAGEDAEYRRGKQQNQ